MKGESSTSSLQGPCGGSPRSGLWKQPVTDASTRALEGRRSSGARKKQIRDKLT